MSQKKNTGLGPSLLLKRTTPPEPTENTDYQTPDAEALERPGVSDAWPAVSDERAESIVEVPDPLPRRATRPKKLRLKRVKSTIYLDVDVNKQLSVAARVEEKERSEVVTEILRIHLPVYRISRTK